MAHQKRTALKARRAVLQLGQRELADRTGIRWSRYVRIENGYSEPTRDEQTAIARVLKIRVREAFPAEV